MKKNSVPAIIIWAFYALMSGCFLFLAILNVCGERGYGPGVGLAAGAGILIALGAGVLGLNYFGVRLERKEAKRNRRGIERNRVPAFALEGALVLVTIIVMVIFRANRSASAYPWYVPEDVEYGIARIQGENGIVNIAHRGREIYLWLMRGFFYLLGNKPEAVVVLQLILLVAAAVSLYLGIRRNAGKITAFLVLIFLGFSPYMVRETCRQSSFLLVLIVYGAAIGLISDVAGKKPQNSIGAVIQYLLTGLAIGFCCYLDMAGITLLIFLTGELCFGREGEVDLDSTPLIPFMGCLVSAVVAFFLCHAIRGGIGGTMGESVYAQLNLYLPQRFMITFMDVEILSGDIVVLAALMAAGIFSFWIDYRIRTKGIWFFAAVLLLFMLGFRMGNQTYFNAYGLLYLMYAAIAGIGFEYMGAWLYQAYCADAVVGEKDMAGSGFEIQQTESPEKLEMESVDQEKNRPDKHSDVQYIENPLPVPKKREHKLMEYDYEVAEDDDYDIP